MNESARDAVWQRVEENYYCGRWNGKEKREQSRREKGGLVIVSAIFEGDLGKRTDLGLVPGILIP